MVAAEAQIGAEEVQGHLKQLVLSTQKKTPGGQPQDTLTCPHSMRVKSIGLGGNLVINVMSLRNAHGRSLHRQDLTTAETSTSLKSLTDKSTICYTTQKRKYMKNLLQTKSMSL